MDTSARAHRGRALPRSRTALIGRDHELAYVLALFNGEDARLVTLTGPGGVGKTRLALEIARKSARSFSDGVVYVPLDAVTHPEQVPLAIAQALGVQEATSDALMELLVWLLRDKRLLLVLDNMEHVIAAANQVGDLLNDCEELVILVTSRQRLSLQGEYEVMVSPLALTPESGEQAHPAAIQLFEARARAAQAGFRLDEGNTVAVYDICRRLDGVPLAIELAAARIKMMAPVALFERLDPSLPLLTGGPRDSAARHHTLRDTIAWSYDRLQPAEQRALQQLAVFAGGCSVPVAECVLSGDRAAGVALDLIADLVDHSLLLPTERPEGVPRLLLLETVREYALGELSASGKESETRARHAACVVDMVSTAPSSIFTGLSDGPTLEVMDTELANIRAASDWFAGASQQSTLLRLIVATRGYFGVRPLQRDVVRWLDACLDSPDGDERDLALAHALAVLMHYDMDSGPSVRAHAESSLRHLETETDIRVACEVRYCAGVALAYSGELDAARQMQESALDLARKSAWPIAAATILAEIGSIQLLSGETSSAIIAIDEALAMHREIGASWSFVIALGERAHAAWLQRQPEIAAACYAEGIAMAELLGDLRTCLEMVAGMSGVALSFGQPARAARLLGAVSAVRDASGIRTSGSRKLLERIRNETRAALTETAFEEAWRAGRALSLAAARADALALAVESAIPIPPMRRSRPFRLTPREIDVIRLLAQGMSDREIAEMLTIGSRTVQTHVGNAFAKMGVNTRAEAVAVAVRSGVI